MQCLVRLAVGGGRPLARPAAAGGGGGAAPNPFLAQLAQQLNQKGVNVSQFSKPQQ